LRRRDIARDWNRVATLIRHAVALPVAVLTVAMVESAFEALLMLPIGLAALEAAGLLSAMVTAVSLSAITTTAEVENRVALVGNTKSLPKHEFGLLVHPHPVAGWTKRLAS
jgi:hypothetical protein